MDEVFFLFSLRSKYVASSGRTASLAVTPAKRPPVKVWISCKAEWVLVSIGIGNHPNRRSFPRKRESILPTAHFQTFAEWIPAFAGMTALQMTPARQSGSGGSSDRNWCGYDKRSLGAGSGPAQSADRHSVCTARWQAPLIRWPATRPKTTNPTGNHHL